MFVAVLAFFSRISDPRFGCTYMTLLNTLANLGYMWTSTVALGMVDMLTVKECSLDSKNNCSTKGLQDVRYYIILIMLGIILFYKIENILHYFLIPITSYLQKYLTEQYFIECY